MSIWEENLSFLKSTAGRIYTKMVNAVDDGSMQVLVDTKKNLVKVKTKDIDTYLGSSFNHSREAERLFASCDENAGLVILLGIGNLHLLSDIKKQFKELKHLIIVEPSIAIFNEIMKNISIRKIFSSFPTTNISIILNEEFEHVNMFYRNFTSNSPAESVAVIAPVSYSRLFPLYRNKISQFVETEAGQQKTSRVTRQFFRYMWHINEWRNLHIDTARVSDLTSLFRKLPVIVVSAGPSLNNNIHLLKEVGNKAIIIAVGSAIKILHNKGIVPHLRFSIEANSLQNRLFEGIDPLAAPLIYTSHINYDILDSYKENSIEAFVYKSYHLEQYMFEKIGIYDPGSISGGPSVSNIAVFLATHLGCPKIILMGQDLCSQLDKHYADGSWASEKENNKIFSYTNKIIMKNIYAQTVTTTDVLLDVRSTLEYAATVYRSRFINATEGGLNIDGYENKRFAEVLYDDLPEQSDIDIKECIADIIKKAKESPAFPRELKIKLAAQYKKELLDLKDLVKKLEQASEKGVENRYLGKLKKLCDDIYSKRLYEVVVGGSFVIDVINVKNSFLNNDLQERKYALQTLTDGLMEFIDLSEALVEEFLTGKKTMRFIYQQ